MLWLSDDDGDPPWWMWVIMTGFLVGSAVVMGHEWHHRRHLEFGLGLLGDAARVLLLLCIYWFSARLWFWFDKS